MSADDWQDACDPVPARRELTDKQKRLLAAWAKRKRESTVFGHVTPSSIEAHYVNPDFDDMGA